MSIDKTAEALFASSDMYQALSAFLHRTEPEFAHALCDGSYMGDIKSILEELGFSETDVEELTAGFAAFLTESAEEEAVLFHAVRRDYTHLFTNPKFSVMTPYEGRFLSGKKLYPEDAPGGGFRTGLKGLYARVGFESQIKPKEYEDHIRMEFEFMQVLRKNQGICVRDNDEDTYQAIESTIQSFFDDYLKVWAVPFFEDVISNSLEDAYRVFGKLALAFLQYEFGC